MTVKLSAVLSGVDWKLSKPRIVEWGLVWKEQLVELIQTDLSLNLISKRLGTSKIVVKNQLIKLGLEEELIKRDVKYTKNESKLRLSKYELEKRKEQYIKIIKESILFIQNEEKEVTRNLIIKNSGTEYRWLQKNYPRELEEIIPKTVEPKDRSNMRYIDWEKREMELIRKLRNAECELKNRRLSVSLIARFLNYYTLHQTLRYMPQLEKEIRKQLEESNEC